MLLSGRQDPKFSSGSNCLFGLSTDAFRAVLPKASVVVLAKVAQLFEVGLKRIGLQSFAVG